MNRKKKPRGVTLSAEDWEEVVKSAKLINYNNAQFMEFCIKSVLEMIKSPEKRRLPLIVKLVDRAKDALHEEELLKDVITIPIHLTDEHGKRIKNEELEKKSDEGQKEPISEKKF